MDLEHIRTKWQRHQNIATGLERVMNSMANPYGVSDLANPVYCNADIGVMQSHASTTWLRRNIIRLPFVADGSLIYLDDNTVVFKVTHGYSYKQAMLLWQEFHDSVVNIDA